MTNHKSHSRKDNSRKSKTRATKTPHELTEQEIAKRTKREFKKICEMAVSFDICYCYLCGQPIHPWQHWNLDHVRPVCRGGKTDFSNLRPVHYDCNQAKAAHSLEQFRYIQELEKGR